MLRTDCFGKNALQELEILVDGQESRNAAMRNALWGLYWQLQEVLTSEHVGLCLDPQDQYDYFGERYLKGQWCIFKDNPQAEDGFTKAAFASDIEALECLLPMFGKLDLLVYQKYGDWHGNAVLVLDPTVTYRTCKI